VGAALLFGAEETVFVIQSWVLEEGKLFFFVNKKEAKKTSLL
jgi:hypothetical protein